MNTHVFADISEELRWNSRDTAVKRFKIQVIHDSQSGINSAFISSYLYRVTRSANTPVNIIIYILVFGFKQVCISIVIQLRFKTCSFEADIPRISRTIRDDINLCRNIVKLYHIKAGKIFNICCIKTIFIIISCAVKPYSRLAGQRGMKSGSFACRQIPCAEENINFRQSDGTVKNIA